MLRFMLEEAHATYIQAVHFVLYSSDFQAFSIHSDKSD